VRGLVSLVWSGATLLGWLLSGLVSAQSISAHVQNPPTADTSVSTPRVSDWLLRVHEAARVSAYIGTVVVSVNGTLSSARIWHACDGVQQVERIDALTGAPRSTFRRNDQVMTFLPERRVVLVEKRESLGLFPNLLQTSADALAQFYRVRLAGHERVAGFEADIVQLHPLDQLRFGYRIWTEKKTGLVIKLQTLNGEGQVLEQVAFSELQLDAPLSMGALSQMMDNTAGYRVEKPDLVAASAATEGWRLKQAVPGFKPMSCHKRWQGNGAGARRESALQWIFSDGLASVSLFMEAYDARHPAQPGSTTLGATSTLTRRMGDWWLTVIGEVPVPTLAAFAQGLEWRK
jgi:sigma-E factor negative regulatory protein RseB